MTNVSRRPTTTFIAGLLFWLIVLGIRGPGMAVELNLKHVTDVVDQAVTNETRANNDTRPCDGTTGHEECDGAADGYYQNDDTRNCSQFYRCDNERRINCSCGAERRFDPVSQSCVFGTDRPPCGHRTNPTHRCSTVGFHVVRGTGCRDYYECRSSDRRRIDHRCPANDTFDVDSLKCRNDFFQCPEEEEEAAAAAVNDDDVTSCQGKSDGKYGEMPSENARFYVCADGIKISEGSCQEGQVFDLRMQSCRDTATASATNACERLPDGYHPNRERRCKSYYYCINGQTLFVKECPEDTLFDLVAKECRTFEAQLSSCWTSLSDHDHDDRCRLATDGYHMVYANNPPSSDYNECRRFILCKAGRRVAADILCPPIGGTFPRCPDVGSKQCLEAETQFRNEEEQDDDCSERTSGRYHPDERTDCRTYYYCKEGKKTAQFACHRGHMFDVLTDKCEPIGRVKCHRRHEPDDRCLNKTDGYFGDSTKRCRTFYQCKRGRTTIELSCLESDAFDRTTQTCRPKHEVVECDSPAPSSSPSPCENEREDGFYPNYSTGCRRYYHCRHSRQSAEYVCTKGQLFDPVSMQCSPAEEVVCAASPNSNSPPSAATEKTTSNECGFGPSTQDGYYHPNYESGCRHYYYCRGGIKMAELACPEGEAFDSETVGCYEELTVKCHRPFTVEHAYDCRRHFDGLYPDVQSGCTSYHVCVNNRLIKTGQCPPGTLFDRRRQSCQPADGVFSCGTTTVIDKDNNYKTLSLGGDQASGGVHLHFGVQCGNASICFDSVDVARTHCATSITSSATDAQKWSSSSAICKIGGLSTMSIDERRAVRRLEPYDCSDKEDGYYTDPSSQCRKWHACEGGQGTTHECNSDEAFNILQRRCEPFHIVDCANQSWVYRNHSSERSIPSAAAARQSTSIALCEDSSDGIYADLGRPLSAVDKRSSTMLCFGAHLCLRKSAYDITCPSFHIEEVAGSVDDDTAAKEVPRNASSTGRTAVALVSTDDPPQKQPSPPTHVRLIHFDCTNRADGFHVHSSDDCHEFHVCHKGQLISSYTCVQPLLFDVATKTCRSAESVACTRTSAANASCEASATDDVLHPADDCRAYFGCLRGVFQHVNCPEGTLFNRRTSKCDSRVEAAILCSANVTFRRSADEVDERRQQQQTPSTSSSSSSSSSFECSARPDGYYPDYGQKCHVFYRCARGKKFSHYCKLGQLFNPLLQSCDFEENVQCQVDEVVDEPS